MTGINFICSCCGKMSRINIPEIARLREEIERIKGILESVENPIDDKYYPFDKLFQTFGGKK